MSGTTYAYTAVDPTGKRRRGRVNAPNERDAFHAVTAEGLQPIRLKPVTQSTGHFSWQRITKRDIASLTRELSVLVEAKIPIARGLLSMSEHEPKRAVREMVRDIATMIESGQPITEALGRYQGVFGDVYIETMRAAERSGNLQSVLEHLADMLERQMESSQMLRRAMAYPIIVLSVVAIAVGVIVVFVVPRFGATFASQGMDLPFVTQLIKALGDSVRSAWWAYLGVVVGAVSSVCIAWRTTGGRLAIERFGLVVPYLRRIIIAVTASRFARVFSIGLDSGLDAIESLELSGRATGRPAFVIECDRMGERLRSGDQLSDVMSGTAYLPHFARRMMAAGKDAKELSSASAIVAKHYDREAEHLTKNINTFIEPILTAMLAGIVLMLALSVFLPMWQMVSMNR